MKSLIFAVVWKEVREIRRDPVTIWVAAGLPLIMLYLFGAALSLDVKEAAFAVYDRDGSAQSRALAEAFPNSGYFRRMHDIRAAREIRERLDRGQARLVLVIPEDFSAKLATGETAAVQTLVDGSFSATAMVISGYAAAIVQDYNLARATRAGAHHVPVTLESRVWFNAPLKSVNYIVPGLFGVILMAFPPLLTALAVVREKEASSVEQIFVSPIRPWQFIAGKMVPYAAIAFIEMLMILVAGLWEFGIPFRGSLALFLLATTIYVFCTVGLGLLISTVTKSQLVAMLLALILTLMPSFLFSGFLFPIFTMPEMMQWYTYLFPARYFIEISRGILMKDVGIETLWPQFALLLAYTAAVFAAATRLFRKKVVS
ncbi:MAG: ABC transporter permease [Thiobacillus sp.]|jgi:ABC-2 type transport system permease protein|uniref:ABC transporter permease n=1 Tax=Thiobacillus sp. TaxID=924 RepID=UPI00289537A4|nr:ABC transporter permease [Thiobacillus sp.]MDT3706227.1 ABC transporter permease [Thiobacillus sp.]